MIVGIPKEIKDNEKRVSLTPSGALELTKAGNTVYVEKNAGLRSGFNNKMYELSGAIIINDAPDLFIKSKHKIF